MIHRRRSLRLLGVVGAVLASLLGPPLLGCGGDVRGASPGSISSGTGGDSSAEAQAKNVPTCVAGQSIACACVGSINGAQVCKTNGTFAACVCDGAGAQPSAPTGVPGAQPDAAASQVGPSYACGPNAGVQCTCPATDFAPAPIDDAGQQQTLVLPPANADVVSYSNQTQFEALAIGRWRRTAGQAELVCETVGVEFTSDHQLYPLVVASDGSVQRVPVSTGTWSASIGASAGASTLVVNGGGYTTNLPIFYAGGSRMYFLYSPWPADYVRMP